MLHAEWGHERVCEFKCEKPVRRCALSGMCVHVCAWSCKTAAASGAEFFLGYDNQ